MKLYFKKKTHTKLLQYIILKQPNQNGKLKKLKLKSDGNEIITSIQCKTTKL